MEPPQFPVDVVIVCAVDVEYYAVLKHLFDLGAEQWDNISVPNDGKWRTATVSFPDTTAKLRIACGKTRGMGMAAAATRTTAAMHAFKPRFLLMPGITAGREGKTSFGDIIVADPISDYGAGRWEDEKGKMVFKARHNQRSIDPEVSSWAEDVRTNGDFGQKTNDAWLALDRNNKVFPAPAVRIAPAVSGAAVIDSLNFWKELITDNKILGLEMEAYGFAFAATNGGSPKYTSKWMVCKSVCDFGANKDKDAQPFAAFCSVKFVERFLREYVMEEDLRNAPSDINVV